MVTLRREAGETSFVDDLTRSIARSRALSNLRRIGNGIGGYSSEFGRFPPTLDALVEAECLDAGRLRSPLNRQRGMPDGQGRPQEFSDYVYIKYPGAIDPPGDLVLVYEQPENYGKTHTSILQVDGDVAYLSIRDFQQRLKKTRLWLGGHHLRQDAPSNPP